jgi:beta-RFAP synthase
LPDLSVEELASSIGRGARSAVGTYGFRYGGLIVDAGKKSCQPLGALAHRLALPAEWRVVLVRPGDEQGLAGDYEADAFARLPPVPEEVTRELWRITEEEMLPALEYAQCSAFGDAVYRFGRLAGECFSAVQGGPFANPAITRLVESIRDYGVPGVGQSSWGPTVFAFTADDAEAQALVRWLRDRSGKADCDIVIARPNNRGAQISTL